MSYGEDGYDAQGINRDGIDRRGVKVRRPDAQLAALLNAQMENLDLALDMMPDRVVGFPGLELAVSSATQAVGLWRELRDRIQ